MPPEGGRGDLLTTGLRHLLDVPAALITRAVLLHERDSHVEVAAGLLAGLDQTPEDVAVVDVGAGGAPGDGRQGLVDLLQGPGRAITGWRGRWWWWCGERRRLFGELIDEDPRIHLLGGVEDARLIHDGGLSGGLAIGAEVVRAGQAHDARGVLAGAIPTSELDQRRLDRRPLADRDGLAQHPVEVRRFAAGGDCAGGLPQAQLTPSSELPLKGPVVPFDEESPAAGDLILPVAAVIDDDIDAAAVLLPPAGCCQVVGALACADAVGVGLGVPAVGVVSMREGAQACGSWLLAKELQEPIRLAPINGRDHQTRGSWWWVECLRGLPLTKVLTAALPALRSASAAALAALRLASSCAARWPCRARSA